MSAAHPLYIGIGMPPPLARVAARQAPPNPPHRCWGGRGGGLQPLLLAANAFCFIPFFLFWFCRSFKLQIRCKKKRHGVILWAFCLSLFPFSPPHPPTPQPLPNAFPPGPIYGGGGVSPISWLLCWGSPHHHISHPHISCCCQHCCRPPPAPPPHDPLGDGGPGTAQWDLFPFPLPVGILLSAVTICGPTALLCLRGWRSSGDGGGPGGGEGLGSVLLYLLAAPQWGHQWGLGGGIDVRGGVLAAQHLVWSHTRLFGVLAPGALPSGGIWGPGS